MRAVAPMALVILGVVALPPTVRGENPTERRLRVLEEQLRKAQSELRELRDQAQQAAEESKTAAAEAKKGLELPDWVRKTTLFGDVRVRHEGFYHQPHKNGQVVNARNRERLRARLGVRIAFSDELSAT